MLSSNVVPLLVALSSSAVAIILAIFNFYERYRREKQDTLMRALEYLTGGSQNRSVGIALIEGLWCKGHSNHRAVIPALTNQAVYLLLQTESKGRRQFHNWLRIMDLIMRVPAEKELQSCYIEIIEALTVRSVPDTTCERGIDITTEAATLWIETIRTKVGLDD